MHIIVNTNLLADLLGHTRGYADYIAQCELMDKLFTSVVRMLSDADRNFDIGDFGVRYAQKERETRYYRQGERDGMAPTAAPEPPRAYATLDPAMYYAAAPVLAQAPEPPPARIRIRLPPTEETEEEMTRLARLYRR